MQSLTSAIIITYNPNVDVLKSNVTNLLASSFIKEIIIVDNGSLNSLDDLKNIKNVMIEYLGSNQGIATAQNVGLQIVQKNFSRFALLLDQDSEIESELVGKLINGFHELSRSGYKIAAVGPRPFDLFEDKKMKPRIQRDKAISNNFSITKQIIASGKLINMDALSKIGMMDDDLFIDGVDHEWCWRAGKYGFTIAIIENAVMRHRLGDGRGKFLGVTYKIGSPVRLYYQFRNILLLSRRSYVPLYWKVRCLVGMVLRFIIFSLNEKDSKIRRYYMIKGIVSGLRKDKGIIDKMY
ncbi:MULTISPECIES: glycosyltransferase family 2 protein [Citrobacter]|uniref:glycosyltransferase family 2 protein n=1 Tax=Citrobacter TaxID=544 RepID=UPI0006BA2157|nr:MULTISPECIES: glycosyltransferase family 2 protein [Citrobacter]ELB4226770.1 glycosyltransferase family 2 protein [Citrobacter amalonaticus]MDM3525377.1 glycosyltransferase family 2 protein [Citrobacter sp. Ca226]UYF54055.1 glycosyltransferase family 2 protein [Citrobacter amalonaticus]HED1790020.1 glycosyltransferase family 2 protein [Citrobacter amalonaticus]